MYLLYLLKPKENVRNVFSVQQSLSKFCPFQAAVMDLVKSDKQRGLVVPVWSCYSQLLTRAGSHVGCCDLPC